MAPDATEGLIRGRYRIVGKLGEGSQGTTFDAVDQASGAPVAIKQFVVKGSKSWKDVELAEREAAVLESLSHPSLPAHVDHFEENGSLYLVMQKIEGENLASLARRGGSLSQSDVVRFLSDAADVLDYLHHRSPPVVHRDINPKNVIRRPDGSFAIVDFGAVRDKLKPEGGSTVVGTFGYMATEQFQGRALPASDVFSVGATAIRMLTGIEPENLPHRGLAIDVPVALGRGVDRNLSEALARMLDPDPDRRAASITPLLEKMKRAAARGPASSQDRDRDSNRSPGAEQRASAGSAWSNDARYEEARHAAREAREEARHAVDQAREDARRAAHEARETAHRSGREARRMARAARLAYRRGRHGRRWRPPFFLPAALFLNLAILMVGLVLGAVVPFVLVVLSVLFGKPLRDAAKNVRQAGQETQAALAAVRSLLMGHDVEARSAAPRMRVEPDPANTAQPPRTRVADEHDVIDTVGSEVTEDERLHRR